MKKSYLLLFTVIIIFTLASCSNKAAIVNDTNIDENFFKSGSDDSNYIELTKVNDNIWVHTTYSIFNGSRTASNGIVAVSSKGLILIDTPWNNGQTKELLKLTKTVFKKDIALALITHAHADRIGGIDVLLESNIDVRSTSLTSEEAEKNGFKKPQPKLESGSKITLGNINMEVFYPGEGHSVDNITVWFPQFKVLFGGCLIKSLESTDLGSTTDVSIQQWAISVENVLEKYPNAEIVIPGHGKWGSLDLIKHTLDLFDK